MEDTIDLVGAYIGDGYLVSVMTKADNDEGMKWALDGEDYEEECLWNVPREIAERLLKQGCSDQYYSDGYDAANVAADYIG